MPDQFITVPVAGLPAAMSVSGSDLVLVIQGGAARLASAAMVSNVTTADPPTCSSIGAAPAGHVGSGGGQHATATIGAAGFMAAADKEKLDGISPGATSYTHPTGDGNSHVPANGSGNRYKALKAAQNPGSYYWGFVDYGELTGIITATGASVAAAGSGAASATAITACYTHVVSGTGGVILPTPSPYQVYIIRNDTAAAINLYPQAAAAINSLDAGVALSVPAASAVMLVADTALSFVTVSTGGGSAVPAAFTVQPFIVAAGTTQAAATALTGDYCEIGTCVAGAIGAILPADPVAGRKVRVRNDGSVAATIFPHVGGKIDYGATNAGVTLKSGADREFISLDGTIWQTTGNAGSGFVVRSVQSYVVAAGTTQATATPLASSYCEIGTCATGATGVILPASQPAGTDIIIRNDGDVTANIWPPTGGQIDYGDTNAATTLAAGATIRLISLDGTIWQSY